MARDTTRTSVLAESSHPDVHSLPSAAPNWWENTLQTGQLWPALSLRTLALVPQALIPSPLSTSWSQLGIGSCRGDDALGQCEVEG